MPADSLTRLDSDILKAHDAYVAVLKQYVAGLIDDIRPEIWERGHNYVEIAVRCDNAQRASWVRDCTNGPPYFARELIPGIHLLRNDGFDREYVLTKGHTIDAKIGPEPIAAGLYAVETDFFQGATHRIAGRCERAIDWSNARLHYPLHPAFYEKLRNRLTWVSKPRPYSPAED